MESFFPNYIKDLINLSQARGIVYTNFLTEDEISCALSVLKKENITNYILYGGYSDSDRKILCIRQYDEYISWPIVILRINITEKDFDLRHQDYLGSILSLGIKRSVIGDICLDDYGAFVFVIDSMADYFIDNLDKIAKYRCNIEKYESDNQIIIKKSFLDINLIVTSNRLDCFVSAITKMSRSKSLDFISYGKVFINGVQIHEATVKLNFGDILTLRGYGKYKIASDLRECNKTSKGRLKIYLKKYN